MWCQEICEDDIFSHDQVVIFTGDATALQAINMTTFTPWDLVFMSVKKTLCPYGGVLDTQLTHGTSKVAFAFSIVYDLFFTRIY